MNPSVLFPDIQAEEWKRVNYPSNLHAPVYEIVCDCLVKSYSIRTVQVIEPKWKKIQLEPAIFKNEDEIVHFYIGQCKECKRVYWCSDHLDWIFWLNDSQKLLTVLNELNIKYITHTNLLNEIGITITTSVLKGDPELQFRFTNKGKTFHSCQITEAE